MDRARRANPNRRKPPGSSTSPQPNPDSSVVDPHLPASPVMNPFTYSPQAAAQKGRANKPLQQSSTFSSPGSARHQTGRKRSRTMDDHGFVENEDKDHGNGNSNGHSNGNGNGSSNGNGNGSGNGNGHGNGNDLNTNANINTNLAHGNTTTSNINTQTNTNKESPPKGGHSLRKRARVDYTLEQIDDEVEVPSSTAAAARLKKRRPEEDLPGTILKRRGGSDDADNTMSSRRRNPARKSSEMRAYKEEVDDDDEENNVKDTIEVGVSYSDIEKSGDNQLDRTKTDALASHLPQEAQASHQSSHSAHQLSTSPQKLTPGEQHAAHAQDAPSPEADHAACQGAAEGGANPHKAGSNSASHGPDHPVGSDRRCQGSVSNAADAVQSGPSEKQAEPQAPGRLILAQTFTQDAFVPVQNSSPETTPTPYQQRTRQQQGQVDAGTSSESSAEEQRGRQLTDVPDHLARSPDQLSAKEPLEGRVDEERADIQLPKRNSAPPALSVEQDGTVAVEAQQTQRLGTAPAAESTEIHTASQGLTNGNVQVAGHDGAVPADDLAAVGELSAVLDEMPEARSLGRWAHLTPYVDGEYVFYPETKPQAEDQSASSEDQTPDDKDAINEVEPIVDDADSVVPEAAGAEAPTPTAESDSVDASVASPVDATAGESVDVEAMVAESLDATVAGESMDATVANTPAAGGEEVDEVDISESQESQEPPEQKRTFRYPKVRSAEDFVAALQDFKSMATEDLFELLDVMNTSLVAWQDEWNEQGKIIDEHENSVRRREADAKYEAKARILAQQGINYEEPEFVVKCYYKTKDKDAMTEKGYLQGQDKIMAAAYGFEHDPHPAKVGRQNPQAQQVGIITRGRSLRNQPKQTAKATEADVVVTGKRQRRPAQVFGQDATGDASRSSTPAPTRGRRRRGANAEADEAQPPVATIIEAHSDGEGPETKRRKRVPRQQQQQQQQQQQSQEAQPKVTMPSIVEDLAPAPQEEVSPTKGTPRPARKARIKQVVKYEDDHDDEQTNDASSSSSSSSSSSKAADQGLSEEPEDEDELPRRHLLTLKIPKGLNGSEPSSAITDNGESPRPSTANSNGSAQTVGSNYALRPKRQKRFRDEVDDEADEAEAAKMAPKKRAKRAAEEAVRAPVEAGAAGAGARAVAIAGTGVGSAETQQPAANRKVQKIKVVRASGAKSKLSKALSGFIPPTTEEGEEALPKDYKLMTKSEKMSASMKNRWAAGNMAGAVIKRKATLAAKKAAQEAAEAKGGAKAKKKTRARKKKATTQANLAPAPAAGAAAAPAALSALEAAFQAAAAPARASGGTAPAPGSAPAPAAPNGFTRPTS